MLLDPWILPAVKQSVFCARLVKSVNHIISLEFCQIGSTYLVDFPQNTVIVRVSG